MRFTRTLGALASLGAIGILAASCSSGKAGAPGSGGAGGSAATTTTSSSSTTTASSSTTSSSTTSSSTTSSSTSSGIPDAGSPDAGPGCGYQNMGAPLQVSPSIALCMPPVVCNAETCPPPLGSCVSGKCVFGAGYQGVATLPQAWATYYCALSTGGCHGVTQLEYPEVTAANIGAALGKPLCDQTATDGCIGIAASSAMVVGNSQLAVDPTTQMQVTDWGLGLTEASGLCYRITGPGGSATVALTDRCGGYCKCNGSGFEECGPCVNAASMEPNCPCVGTAPSLYTACCGQGCPTLQAECDWCASNNHPHFDLDTGTFNWVCGADSVNGSCQLTSVGYVPCLTATGWPPGGGGGSCKTNAFQCNSTPAAHQDTVPQTTCCCNYDDCPQPDGSCAAAPATCKAGSCACGAGQPDAEHPSVPSTGCCCTYGTTPEADGSCQ